MSVYLQSYHSDDLQVLQIRSLCGQELFGDEVRFIGREPLWAGEKLHFLKIL